MLNRKDCILHAMVVCRLFFPLNSVYLTKFSYPYYLFSVKMFKDLTMSATHYIVFRLQIIKCLVPKSVV